MPAIAPPERPDPPPLEPPAAAVLDEGGREVTVLVKRGGMEVVLGRCTFEQRDSACEFTQQESVALGELAAQKVHKPPRFDEKPQLSGSFCTPSMHDPLRESAGRAQLVKSARI